MGNWYAAAGFFTMARQSVYRLINYIQGPFKLRYTAEKFPNKHQELGLRAHSPPSASPHHKHALNAATDLKIFHKILCYALLSERDIVASVKD